MFELVGIPYSQRGITPEEGLSCWGVIRYVLVKECGLELPEHAPLYYRWSDYVTIYKPPLPKLRKHDVVMFSEILEGLINHLGVMADDSNFVHSGHLYGGVVCEPISRHYDKIVAIGRPKL